MLHCATSFLANTGGYTTIRHDRFNTDLLIATTQTRFNANRLKVLNVCVGYIFCVDSLELCSQTYQHKIL